MKILTILLGFILYSPGLFSQQSNKLDNEENNVIRLLHNNFNPKNLKDDSTYTFAIEIIPIKNGYSIKTTSKIAYEIFGNIDSLFKMINFDLFQDRKVRRRIIIPVGIIVVNSGNKNRGAIVNVEKLPSAIGTMFNVVDKKYRYQSIYLRPYFSILDNVILY